MLYSTRQERHRAFFSSSVEDCAYRLSTIFELPSVEHTRCPRDFDVELTWNPAQNRGAEDVECSSADDLSLPASNEVESIDISNAGLLKAFIDDLRTDRDRELVEPSASSENQPRPFYRTGLSL
jgi:hypothetical protein